MDSQTSDRQGDRIEFEIECSSTEAPPQFNELKVGSTVFLEAFNGEGFRMIAVLGQDTRIGLGLLPSEHVRSMENGAWVGHIRTVRRDFDTHFIHSITLRFQRDGNIDKENQEGELTHDELSEEDRLTSEQLLSIGQSKEVQRYLRDERLQRVIYRIDSASDPDAELLESLRSPHFKSFSDELLDIIHSSNCS